jgi:hypothetical protein
LGKLVIFAQRTVNPTVLGYDAAHSDQKVAVLFALDHIECGEQRRGAVTNVGDAST